MRSASQVGPPLQEDKGLDPGRYDPTHSFTSNRRPSFSPVQLARRVASPTTEAGSKRRTKSRAEKVAFGLGSRRVMRFEGDEAHSPGPAAYAPPTTFGRYQKQQSNMTSSSKQAKGRKAGNPPSSGSSVFRSASPQRPAPENEHVPGAGTYSPQFTAIEPDLNIKNAAPHLRGKGERFGQGSMDWADAETEDGDIGPGAYNSHVFLTLAWDTSRKLQQKSRNSPGFGVATPAHQLPHEEPIELFREDPGPGQYETNTSDIPKAAGNGHLSAFRHPIERKKLKHLDAMAAKPARGKGKGKKKPQQGADGIMRV